MEIRRGDSIRLDSNTPYNAERKFQRDWAAVDAASSEDLHSLRSGKGVICVDSAASADSPLGAKRRHSTERIIDLPWFSLGLAAPWGSQSGPIARVGPAPRNMLGLRWRLARRGIG